ncbi:Long-chain-fatty-acid--CoA ligase [Lentzea sp. NPDC003310]|uniref:Long-chain-fatty-acid--CoA ligase n=1 Tax=Lentzea sp. NPDC003310 TaxID=3154447 RepID=UPI0033AABA1B
MEIVSNASRPDLQGAAQAALRDGWPPFVLRGQVPATHRAAVAEYFPRYDVLLVEDDLVLARATAVALRWDGEPSTLPDGGYDGALVAAVAGHESGVVPDTLCVVAATVRADRIGGGLAGRVLTGLRERAAEDGLARVVVPVRPTSKADHPLTSMDEFQRWTREDGLHVDPWIRTHQRLGATILGPAPRSMVVTGTVAEWERWTGMAFPHSGRYVVAGGLDLVEIDREREQGVYEETNLWMRHPVRATS